MESRPEKMGPLEGLLNDAASTTEEQTESGASIQRMTVMLRETLQTGVHRRAFDRHENYEDSREKNLLDAENPIEVRIRSRKKFTI